MTIIIIIIIIIIRTSTCSHGTNCLEKGVSQVKEKIETEETKRHRKVTFMRPKKLPKRSPEGSCNDLSRPLGAKVGP